MLEPRGITLDCESHFRDISSDTTPKEAKAIAGKVIEMVEASGSKVTRKHFAAAAAAVRPKPAAATRPDVPDSIEAEIADREPAEESVHSTSTQLSRRHLRSLPGTRARRKSKLRRFAKCSR